MANYSIDYDVIDGAGTTRPCNGYACFTGVHDLGAQFVVFTCPMGAMTDEQLDHYIEFLVWMLGDERWTWCVEWDFSPMHQVKVVFWMDCTGLYYKKSLVYLTCFRYIKERPDLALVPWNNKNKTMEEIFQLFQDAHRGPEYNDGVHTLLAAYGQKQNITIETFRANLTNMDQAVLHSVMVHFNEHKAKA